MNALTRFLSAPHRTVQIAIWTMLVAVLATVVPMSTPGTGPTAAVSAVSPSSPTSVDDVLTVAAADTLTLAGVGPAGPDARASVDDPVKLLPAYRWMNDMSLPEDNSKDAAGTGRSMVTGMAEFGFAISGFVWWALLELMNFAMGVDVITSFAGAINSFFATTFTGLNDAGIPVMIGIFVFAGAALAALKGKLHDGVRMAVSALLVLGLLQTLGVAAQDDTGSGKEGAVTAAADVPKFTPAWLAQTGNGFVNELGGQVTEVFGLTSGITTDVRSGGADGGAESVDDPSCAYYNQRLYATYVDEMLLQGRQSTSNAMTMVSYMWQRSMYDSWVQAAFGSPALGAPAACHYLERAAGITPIMQKAIAGAQSNLSPYYDDSAGEMKPGPFTRQSDKKPNQASEMMWSVCLDRNTFRGAWGSIKPLDGKTASDICGKWWSSETGPGTSDGLLEWGTHPDMLKDTTGVDPNNADLAEIKQYVESYWGHNSGQRLLASSTAGLTAVLYTMAFGMPAIGVLMAQFVLLFMLILLPWTLILLAAPGKNGQRNQVGIKLLKLTAAAFTTKLIFLIVLGATLTLMSALFSLTFSNSVSSYDSASDGTTPLAAVTTSGMSPNMMTFWSVLVPIISIIAMKQLMKAAGLGNLMGVGGAMGFATAAAQRTKEGKQAVKALGGAAGKSKIAGKITAGKEKLSQSKFGKEGVKSRIKGDAKAAGASLLMNRKGKGGKFLDEDLAAKVAGGKTSIWEAKRQQKARDFGRTYTKDGDGNISTQGGLPDDLAKRVANGELTKRGARLLHSQQLKRSAYDSATNAKAGQNGAPDELKDALEDEKGAAGGLPVVPGAPPFKAEGLGDTGALAHDLAMRRSGLGSHNAQVSGSAEWHRDNTALLGTEHDQLVASTRTDGSTAPLTLSQQETGLDIAKAAAPAALRSRLLLGNSGSPVVMRPSVDTSDRLRIDPSVLSSPEACYALIANPLNHIDPRVVAQKATENDDEYHTRMNVTLLETGLRDTSGNVADLAASFNIDKGSAGWEDRAVQVVRDMQSQGVYKVLDRVTVNADQLDRIQGVTYKIMRSTPALAADDVDLSAGKLSALQGAAVSARDATAAVNKTVAAAIQTLSASMGDPKETGKATAILIQQAESAAPRVLRQAMAVEFKSKVLTEQLAGGQADLEKLHGEVSKRLEGVEEGIMAQIARLKLTNSDSNRDELLALAKQIQDSLTAASQAQQTATTAAEQGALTRNARQEAKLRTTLEDHRRLHNRADPFA